MLTSIDQELFPDDCEVVEIPSHNLWAYLIQKNGSSSLRELVNQGNARLLKNRELETLETVDVYVRDPKARYISGINTFVKMIKREHPTVDLDTCIYFATRYNFLNRHYLPQWHWLVNLMRFVNPECVIRIHSVEELETVTDLRLGPYRKITPVSEDIQKKIPLDGDIALWFFIDDILRHLVGRSMTWQEIKDHYRTHHLDVWSVVMEKFSALQHELR